MGIPYERFQPDTIRQTNATIESSKLLGFCSRMGSDFRKEFEEVITPFKGRRLENRFTGALKKWLQTKPFEGTLPATHLPFVDHFQFNELDDLHDRLHVKIRLQEPWQDGWMLHIPAFAPAVSIGAPAYTTSVRFTVIAACYHIAARTIAVSHSVIFSVPYNDTFTQAQKIALSFIPPAKSITLVVVALQYIGIKNRPEQSNDDMRRRPCGVVCGWVR